MAVNRSARIGDGATLAVGVSTLTSVVTNESTSNYTNMGQLLTFNPQMECSEHDVTHTGSGGARQYIPGHLAATVQATLNLVPVQDTSVDGSTSAFMSADAILDVYQGRTHRNFLLGVPTFGTNAADTNTTFYVAVRGFITNLSWSGDRDAPATADLTIRVSDSVFQDQNST